MGSTGYREIVHGNQIVHTISALEGETAERILRIIAHPESHENSARNRRVFFPWSNGITQGTVLLKDGTVLHLTLKLGVREGLFLKDVAGNRLALKDRRNEFTLEVGVDLPRHKLRDAAKKIVGTWVAHGRGWINRAGEILEWPYGHDEARPSELLFRIVDGTAKNLTLRDFIDLHGFRSTHVGQWNRPYVTVPAACGVQTLLHEFKESNLEIREFLGAPLTDAPASVWGPYCEWTSSARAQLNANGLNRIAAQAATPFAFHVHATRHRFPNCTMASHFFLERFGEKLLGLLLSGIARYEPERFYRLISAAGVTSRLRKTSGSDLFFEQGERFDLAAAPENVLQTFRELSRVQEDPSYRLARIPRLVLDSHAYVVLLAAAELCSPNPRITAHHLSGSEMYAYLVSGNCAESHRKRNDRLFRILAGTLHREGINALNGMPFEFHIYPPIPYEGVNQYSFDPASFSEHEWLARPLA